MPDQGVDEILTQKHKRAFIQIGGPRPNNPARYAGQDAQYIAVSGVSAPEAGGIEPVWVHDPNRKGKYKLVSTSIEPPDLATAEVMMREKHSALPRQLLRSCPFNLYEQAGRCSNLSDFSSGWDDYVLVYSGAKVTDKDLGDRIAFDSDDAIEDSLSVTLDYVYPVGPLGFGENAGPQIDREAIDIVFAQGRQCANCDNGDQWVYAVVTSSGAGSPGLPAELIYSVNGGLTWSQTNITGFGATEAAYGIDVVGEFLVIIGEDAYYYASINQKTGVPGSFTKVTTGFVAAKSPRDLVVLSPREVYFVGLGGYIYKSEDVTAGVTAINEGTATTSNLLRIKDSPDGETIVATGANGAVIKSNNRGRTWSAVVSNPENLASIQAIEVLDSDRYWIGTSTGRVYSTQDGGETWQSLTHPDLVAGSVIRDILFPTQEVGYISFDDSTPTAKMLTTWNGGANWTRNQYRILNYPTFDRGNRIAVPATDDPGWAANTVAIAGLAGDGTDGIIVLGTTSKV